MTELDLAPIKQRLDAAAPEPWSDMGDEIVDANGSTVMSVVTTATNPKILWEDRLFLVNTPTDIAALIAEVERLRRWKREAMLVMGDWEQLYETLGRPGMIGQSKAYGAASYVGRLQGENMRLRKQVESLESTLMKDH